MAVNYDDQELAQNSNNGWNNNYNYFCSNRNYNVL